MIVDIAAQDIVEHQVVLPHVDTDNKDSVEVKVEDSGDGLDQDQEAAIYDMASENWGRLTSGPKHLSKKCNNKLRRRLLGLRSKILNGVEGNSVSFEKIGKAIESSDLAEDIMPFIVSSYVDGAKSAVGDIVDMGIPDGGFNGEQAERVMDLAVSYCNERHEELSAIVEDIGIVIAEDLRVGIKIGENGSELKDRIRKIFNVAIRKSSDLAELEVFDGFNSARVDMFGKLENRRIEYINENGERLEDGASVSGGCKLVVVAA